MEPKKSKSDDVSITSAAALYVICLVVGGLSVLNAFLHAGSVLTVLACALAALTAIAGIVYCTRKLGRVLGA